MNVTFLIAFVKDRNTYIPSIIYYMHYCHMKLVFKHNYHHAYKLIIVEIAIMCVYLCEKANKMKKKKILHKQLSSIEAINYNLRQFFYICS